MSNGAIFICQRPYFTSEIASDAPQVEANHDRLINNDETLSKKTASTIQKVQGDT